MARSAARRQASTALAAPPARRALEPVVGEVGEAGVGVGRRRRGLEQLGDRAVQPDPLERHELGQQHLADERVGEPEPAGRAGLLDDQAGPARLGDLVDRARRRAPARRARGRSVVPTTAATDSASLVRVGQPRQPPARGLPHAFGQRARLPRAAGLLDVAQHLDEEERVARGDLGELAARGPGRSLPTAAR